ncbi:MAG: ribosome biogenesis GTPase Der [Myxococcaceae bacterium]
MKPLVALVGRPNVGKSTLFNRLVGRRLALVEDRPGVTRDRHYADTSWAGRELSVVDTGGFVPAGSDDVLEGVRAQAEIAVETCDVVLLLVDGRTGPMAADAELGALLRRSGKPVLVVVNKLDHPPVAETAAAEFYQLGFPEVFPVSAEHALGIDALLDSVVRHLPPPEESTAVEGEELDDAIRVAIIGRPNAGKSTLVNALLGQERQVAGPVPGTTRDPIDSELLHAGRRLVLTDTAGIRKKRASAERVERVSILGALRSVDRSDIAVLVLDATEPGVEQDARLAGMVEEKGRGLVVLVNKWDLVKKDERKQEEFREALKWQLRFVAYAPILFGSALQARQVEKVLDVAVHLFDQFRFRAPTPMLNRLLQKVVDAHPAPSDRGRPLRFYYITQVASSPPTFALTCNRPRSVTQSYRRYLTNQLREALELRVPLHLVFRARPGHNGPTPRKGPRG